MSSSDVTPAQTPAQWAVRWHGLVVVALLLASVPVVHLFGHGLLGLLREWTGGYATAIILCMTLQATAAATVLVRPR